jgi:hypothetical protein
MEAEKPYFDIARGRKVTPQVWWEERLGNKKKFDNKGGSCGLCEVGCRRKKVVVVVEGEGERFIQEFMVFWGMSEGLCVLLLLSLR